MGRHKKDFTDKMTTRLSLPVTEDFLAQVDARVAEITKEIKGIDGKRTEYIRLLITRDLEATAKKKAKKAAAAK